MDARLSFLARAAARWWLVDKGEMSLDTAFDGLINDILERKAIEKHFNAVWRQKMEKRLQTWRADNGLDSMLRVRSPTGNKTNKEGENIQVLFMRGNESKDNT